MPQVFPVLYKYLGEIETQTEGEVEVLEHELEEDVLIRLDSALKMRLVSNSWKQSVDMFLQEKSGNDLDGFINDDGYDQRSEIPEIPYSFSVFNMRKLESLMLKDFPHDSNPFISRYLSYMEPFNRVHQRLRPQLRKNFRTMLESFGSQIWECHLSFRCSYSITARRKIYELVRNWLTLMPNLKILAIRNEHINTAAYITTTCTDPCQVLLQRKPMPTLMHLRKLTMTNVQFPISEGIVLQNPKLHNLSVIGDGYKIVPSHSIDSVMLHEIEILTVNLFLDVDFKLEFQNPVLKNLKCLHLSLARREPKEVIAAFSSSSFTSSLEYLFIEVKDRNIFFVFKEGLENFALELPNLKKFKFSVTVPMDVTTIDFLAKCTELQEIRLEIPIPSRTSGISNRVIQFENCIGSMQNSNIWQLLPMLTMLKIQTNIQVSGPSNPINGPKICYTYTKGQRGNITSNTTIQ
ncbi:unnamed protein product [Orchesella dallaii]